MSRTMPYFSIQCRFGIVSFCSSSCLCWFSGEYPMCLDKMFSDRKNNIVHSKMLCIKVKIVNFDLSLEKKNHSISIITMWELKGGLLGYISGRLTKGRVCNHREQVNLHLLQVDKLSSMYSAMQGIWSKPFTVKVFLPEKNFL